MTRDPFFTPGPIAGMSRRLFGKQSVSQRSGAERSSFNRGASGAAGGRPVEAYPVDCDEPVDDILAAGIGEDANPRLPVSVAVRRCSLDCCGVGIGSVRASAVEDDGTGSPPYNAVRRMSVESAASYLQWARGRLSKLGALGSDAVGGVRPGEEQSKEAGAGGRRFADSSRGLG